MTSSPAASRRLAFTLSFIGLALALIWLPVHFSLPLGRDQAIIGLVANRMLGGAWPYSETWDHKGPTAHLLYAVMILLSGGVRNAASTGDLIFLAVAFVAVRAIGRGLRVPLLASASTAAMLLLTRNDIWTFGQPDMWIAHLWLAVIAIHAVPRPGRGMGIDVAAGFVIGIGIMLKPVYALLLILPAYLALRRFERHAAMVRIAVTLISCIATAGSIVLYFSMNGRFASLFETLISFNLSTHAGALAISPGESLFVFMVVATGPWMDPGAVAIKLAALSGGVRLYQIDRETGSMIGISWILGLLIAFVQAKSFSYHFSIANAAIAVSAGFFVVDSVRRLQLEWHRRTGPRFQAPSIAGALLLAIGVSLSARPHAAQAWTWWASQVGATAQTAFSEKFCTEDFCPSEIDHVSQFLKRVTSPTERIFVWGADAGLYVGSDREPATRFIFNYPLIAFSSTWRNEMRAEVMSILHDTMPLIVVQKTDANPLSGNRPSCDHLPDYPELEQLIRQSYIEILETRRFIIYRSAAIPDRPTMTQSIDRATAGD